MAYADHYVCVLQERRAGKTTAAIVLATTLARRHKVVLVDVDPVGRLMAWSRKGPVPGRLQVRNTQGEKFIRGELLVDAAKSDFVIVDLEGAASRLNAYAMGESDLVIIPMGDDQQDAEAAIETLAQVNLEGRMLKREIPARILFSRTQAAVKSRLARSLNAQVRDRVGAFERELHTRTAIASLHSYGGTLYDMVSSEISGVSQAIANAELFAEEVLRLLDWLETAGRQAARAARKEEGRTHHDA